MASGIEQLIELVKNNPEIAKMLTSSVNIDSILELVKSKGVDIAKNELQEYISKNFDLGDVANTILKSDAAGDLLKGIFGKK